MSVDTHSSLMDAMDFSDFSVGDDPPPAFPSDRAASPPRSKWDQLSPSPERRAPRERPGNYPRPGSYRSGGSGSGNSNNNAYRPRDYGRRPQPYNNSSYNNSGGGGYGPRRHDTRGTYGRGRGDSVWAGTGSDGPRQRSASPVQQRGAPRHAQQGLSEWDTFGGAGGGFGASDFFAADASPARSAPSSAVRTADDTPGSAPGGAAAASAADTGAALLERRVAEARQQLQELLDLTDPAKLPEAPPVWTPPVLPGMDEAAAAAAAAAAATAAPSTTTTTTTTSSSSVSASRQPGLWEGEGAPVRERRERGAVAELMDSVLRDESAVPVLRFDVNRSVADAEGCARESKHRSDTLAGRARVVEMVRATLLYLEVIALKEARREPPHDLSRYAVMCKNLFDTFAHTLQHDCPPMALLVSCCSAIALARSVAVYSARIADITEATLRAVRPVCSGAAAASQQQQTQQTQQAQPQEQQQQQQQKAADTAVMSLEHVRNTNWLLEKQRATWHALDLAARLGERSRDVLPAALQGTFDLVPLFARRMDAVLRWTYTQARALQHLIPDS